MPLLDDNDMHAILTCIDEAYTQKVKTCWRCTRIDG